MICLLVFILDGRGSFENCCSTARWTSNAIFVFATDGSSFTSNLYFDAAFCAILYRLASSCALNFANFSPSKLSKSAWRCVAAKFFFWLKELDECLRAVDYFVTTCSIFSTRYNLVCLVVRTLVSTLFISCRSSLQDDSFCDCWACASSSI